MIYVILICIIITTGDKSKPPHSHSKFPIGAAISIKLLKTDPKYGRILINEFNSITAENDVKMKDFNLRKIHSFAKMQSILPISVKKQ